MSLAWCMVSRCFVNILKINYSAMMPKWRVCKPSLLHHCFGGKGVCSFFVFCPRLWNRLVILQRQRIKRVARFQSAVTESKTVVTWCLRAYIGLRPYMVNVYIKERINDQKTICAVGGGGGHQ